MSDTPLTDAYEVIWDGRAFVGSDIARDLERQLAEAKVDAERYRWLRTANWIDWDAMPLIVHDGLDMPELLDAAIDAARRKP